VYVVTSFNERPHATRIEGSDPLNTAAWAIDEGQITTIDSVEISTSDSIATTVIGHSSVFGRFVDKRPSRGEATGFGSALAQR